jgi:hypothetical protein
VFSPRFEDELLTPRSVVQCDDAVLTPPRDEDEASRHRRDQRVAATVVGVFPENLEAPRHPERVLRSAFGYVLEGVEDEVEQDPLAEDFVVVETELLEPGREP